jgi:uncharacterized membrane protein YkvA (DUF1232 family)
MAGGEMPTLREKAKRIKRDCIALYFALRDHRTPWYAKWFIALVVGYALSPIDLIPDFIPVIGYLDDLIILPLGIWLALRMIPAAVIDDCRARALEWSERNPTVRIAGFVVVGIWIALSVGVAIIMVRYFR